MAVLLQSCSGIFNLRPSGHLTNVTFRFYQTPEDQRPSRFRIDRLSVQKRIGRDWKLVWQLDGSRRLDAVAYGQDYPGLHAETGPEPLVRGGRYRVFATSGGLGAGAEFTIDSEGNVVVLPRTI